MKIYYITYTKENIPKCKDGSKTMTRRVIEKIDHYKNIKPGDILVTRKNRFSKVEVDRNVCVKTWTERVQDITTEDIKKEGVQSMAEKLELDHELTGHTNGHRWQFMYLWDSINKDRGYEWKNNPRVRVIEFKQVDK